MAENGQKSSLEVRIPLLSVRPIFARHPITISQILPTTAGLRLFCGRLFLLGALFVLAGCGEPARKVMTTWQGDPIDERRTNEKVILGSPVLDAITGSEIPGSFRIAAKQRELTTFDLEEGYEEVGVVRHLSDEQVEKLKGDSAKSASIGIFLGSMWIIPPAGATMTAGAAVVDKQRSKKRAEVEQAAIEQVKEGEAEVTVPVNYRWSTLDTDFKREKVGEETLLTGADSEEQVVAAAQLQFKVENSQRPSQRRKGHTDDSGRVSFGLADTLAEAAALKPEQWKISAKWEGKWQELGVANITPEWIEQVRDDIREKNMYAIGTPLLPPAAGVSLKVSNGRLKAGMQSDIALTVFNVGKGEFYRLVATTESAVPALNGLEFDFGKLGVREGLTLVRRISIPRRQSPGQAVVRFRWSELNGYAPEPLDAGIPLISNSVN